MTSRITVTRRFAVAAAIGMLVVLLMGARVTATGSGEGCGNDWPLCHGSWLPHHTYESITEYSHRIVTGVEGILVAIASILSWPMRQRYPEVKLLVPLMAGTLVLQSLMGAAAVKWPTSPEVMATHFGISLICLASAALLARVLSENRTRADVDFRMNRGPGVTDLRMIHFRRFAIVSVVTSVLVAYSGAYVRHSGAELACSSWPTCNGALVPQFDGLHGIQTLHRLAALAITLLLFGLLVLGYRNRGHRPDLFIVSTVAMLLVLLQSLIGAIVVKTGLQLLATLAHAGVMSLLFITLCDSVRLSWTSQGHRSVKRVAGQLPGMVAGD